MDNQLDKIKFKVSSLAEYTGMLYWLTKNKKCENIPEEIEILLEEMDKRITPLIQSDLAYFNSYLQMYNLPRHYATYKNIESVEEFLDSINALSSEELWALILDAIFSLPSDASDEDIAEMIENDEFLTLNNYSYDGVMEFKSQLESLLPRLILFFRKFYDSVYAPLDGYIMPLAEKQRNLLIKEYNNNSTTFIKNYIKVNSEIFIKEASYKVDFYVCICNFDTVTYTIPNDHPEEMYIMFGYLVAAYFKEQVSEEIVKSIGETTRMMIVKLLSQESMYASQIAENLNLNRATISHHIDQLVKTGVVKIDYAKGKKVYYGIDIKNIREGFDLFINMLDKKGLNHE